MRRFLLNSEIVYLFVYDAGARFSEEQLKGLLKNPEDFSKYEYNKPRPEEIPAINVPSIFNLKDETLDMAGLQYRFRVQASVYTTGQFVIRVRHATADDPVVALGTLTFDPAVATFVKNIAGKAKARVESSLVKIGGQPAAEETEAYRFYYIESDRAVALKKYKKFIAGLLIDEHKTEGLDEGYLNVILSRNISYYEGDIHFVGWESAVLVDRLSGYEHELLIVEIANVQMLELRILHKRISRMLASANSAIAATGKHNYLTRRYGSSMRRLNRELGDFYDKTKEMVSAVTETPQGLGEWYLAKLYALLASEFKLSELESSLAGELDMIDKSREFVSDVIRGNTEEWLEIIIILLIVLEVVVEVALLLK
ncbi:MAG: hypothetical protein M1474_01805 [Candidatus Marsarchaeota archaeon]|jgi:hypothetical protein|nr:hypothetical protein [Candidatus Marsarchaeota archaeon]